MRVERGLDRDLIQLVFDIEDYQKPYRSLKLASSRIWQRLPSGSTKFATVSSCGDAFS